MVAISQISEISQKPVGVGWGSCDKPDKRDKPKAGGGWLGWLR